MVMLSDINKKMILIFAIILLILIMFLILFILQGNQNNSEKLETFPISDLDQFEKTRMINTEEVKRFNYINNNIDPNYYVPEVDIFHPSGLIQSYNPMNDDDLIKMYDYKRAFDPLEQPARRIPRDQMPPFYLKRLIDIPTKGFPDDFTQLGVLVNEGDITRNDQNRIIRLFGRQAYPSSNRYEYYTLISSGNDQIKIPIHNRNGKELYDDDHIYIKELDDKYRVYLHKYDEPTYRPDLIY